MIVDEGHRMKNANSKLSSTITQYYTHPLSFHFDRYSTSKQPARAVGSSQFRPAQHLQVRQVVRRVVQHTIRQYWWPRPDGPDRRRAAARHSSSHKVFGRSCSVVSRRMSRRICPTSRSVSSSVDFSALQAKLYKQLVTHNKIAVSDGKGGKTGMRGLSNMLMQLRKLCNHPFVFEPVEDQMNPSRHDQRSNLANCRKVRVARSSSAQVPGHRSSSPDVLPDDSDHEHHGGLPPAAWLEVSPSWMVPQSPTIDRIC